MGTFSVYSIPMSMFYRPFANLDMRTRNLSSSRDLHVLSGGNQYFHKALSKQGHPKGEVVGVANRRLRTIGK